MRLKNIYVRSSNGTQVPLSAIRALRADEHVAGREPPGTISVGDAVVQSDARRLAERGDARRSTRPVSRSACRRRFTPASREPRRRFRIRWRASRMLILAALVAVYIVLGILYESYIHPITILSTLPSAGVGALLACCCSTRS